MQAGARIHRPAASGRNPPALSAACRFRKGHFANAISQTTPPRPIPAVTPPGLGWPFQLSIPTLPPLYHPRGVSFPLFGGHWHHPLSWLVHQDSWRGSKGAVRRGNPPRRLKFYPNRADGQKGTCPHLAKGQALRFFLAANCLLLANQCAKGNCLNGAGGEGGLLTLSIPAGKPGVHNPVVTTVFNGRNDHASV